MNTSKSHLFRAKKNIQNYLINHAIERSKPKNNKKKTILLLALFGFTEVLWAKSFGKRFSDFKITPLKKLEVPEHIIINDPSFPTPGQGLRNKIIIGTIILIITGLAFTLYLKKYSSTKNIPFDTQVSKNTVKKEENPEKKSNPVSNKEKTYSPENLNIKNNKEYSLQQTATEIENILNQKIQSRKIMIKDSAEESSKKVIVIKKIITRDTIFLER